MRKGVRSCVHLFYFGQKKDAQRICVERLFGADNRIRTGDLVLTKDVLCLLSHSSKMAT